MNVVCVRRWDEIAPLAAHWNSLLATSAADTPFLTWEWVGAWWRTYGGGRPLHVLAAWDRDELVGVAPMFLDRRGSRLPHRSVLRFVGAGSHDSDYLDWFARRGREPEVVEAFVDHLERHRDGWGWLELEGPLETSPCLAALLERARSASWLVASEPIPCLTLRLPAQWEDYLRRLSPRVRSKVRSSLAMLERDLYATPLECRDPVQLDAWLPVLFDLHTRRWARQALPGVLRSAVKQQFYRDVSRAMLTRGWLAFHRLDWGERPLALQYGFSYGGRFYLLQEGYDPDFASLRPGQALRAWLIRHWIAAGPAEYDFLAGVAQGKLDWGAEAKTSMRVRLGPPRAHTRLAFALPSAVGAAKAALRRVTPRVVLDGRVALARWRRGRRWAPPADTACWWRRSWIDERLYGATPLGRLAGRFASRYELRADWPASGILPLRRRSPGAYQILVYHRIDDEADLFLPAVSPRALRQQLEHVARCSRVVRLDDLIDGVPSDAAGQPAVAITFDGGYRDVLTQALPILRDLGLPATVFLPTAAIASGDLRWHDQVRLAFKLTVRPRLVLPPPGTGVLALETRQERLTALGHVLAWLRALDEDARQEATTALFHALGVRTPRLPNALLGWDDVRQLARGGVDIGAQSVTHPVLARVTGARLVDEVTRCKREIEAALQRPPRHFAYPFGTAADFGPEVTNEVRRAGFESAVTLLPGANGADTDRFVLRRFAPAATPASFRVAFDWARFAGTARAAARPDAAPVLRTSTPVVRGGADP